MFGYIDPFYVASEKSLTPGQVWSDQPLYMPPRHGLKVTRVNARDDRDLDFEICGRTADTFDHPPIASLGLGHTEAAVVARAKKDRPVIVLGGLNAVDLSAQADRATHNETAWIVPVYGASQFSEPMTRRIAYYEFTNLFYLPEAAQFGFREGFARLDHAQPVRVHHLSKHRGLRLADEALDALVEWFINYATKRLPADSLITEYRSDMLTDMGT
jgi:hypothetical protein